MRIMIVAPPWLPVPPPAYGGTETVLDGLARGLKAAGQDVLLYTTGESTCPVERSWVFERAIGVGLGGAAAEIRHVVHAYAAAHEVDVVHDHTLIGPLYSERFPRLPVVTTNHGPFESDLIDLYRIVADRVPIIAISHHQASTAGDVPIAAVIHHGVDPAEFPVGDGTGGYALFLGRMNPGKGAHVGPGSPGRPGSGSRSPGSAMSSWRSTTSTRLSSRCSVPTSSISARSTTRRSSTSLAARRCCSTRSPGPSRSAW